MSRPQCSRTSCPWPATHTVDTPSRPRYAGPELLCKVDARAAIAKAAQDGVPVRVRTLKEQP